MWTVADPVGGPYVPPSRFNSMNAENEITHLFAELSGAELQLLAQVTKPKQEKDESVMTKCLWNTMEFYQVLIERVVRKHNLYFRMQVNYACVEFSKKCTCCS